jgi:hypothetical protein
MVIEANSNLIDLTGLDNVSSVGGFMGIASNSSLTSLNGLGSLTSVGFLTIRDNDALSSLTGLESISAGNISRLYIVGNAILTDCAIDNVCAFLAVPGSLATIGKNADGCRNRAEVEEACNEGGIIEDINTSMLVGTSSTPTTPDQEVAPSLSADGISVGTTTYGGEIKLYPNPTNSRLQVRNIVAQSVIVFNPQGQRVAQFDNPGTELDMSNLSAGVYYLNFLTAEGSITKRIVKVD